MVCVLVPDDVIPSLPLTPPRRRAHGRRQRLHARVRPLRPGRATSAWSRPACSGPRCGAATRRASGSSPPSACTATSPARRGRARSRSRRRSAGCVRAPIELTPMQEAVLDLGVEQALSPALTLGQRHVRAGDARAGHPARSRSSPSSCCRARSSARCGSCARRATPRSSSTTRRRASTASSRAGASTTTSTSAPTMRRLVDDITSGRFADEWDAERDAGYPKLSGTAGTARRPRGARVRESAASGVGGGGGHPVAAPSSSLVQFAWNVLGRRHPASADEHHRAARAEREERDCQLDEQLVPGERAARPRATAGMPGAGMLLTS